MAQPLLARLLTRRRGTLDDILSTMLSNLLVMVSGVLAVGLAARIFSNADFGAYVNLRRVNVALSPVFSLGLSMAVTRYMPLVSAQGPPARRRLLLVCCGIVCLSLGAAAIIMLTFAPGCASLLLGDSAYAPYMLGFVLTLAGTVLFQQIATYFTGRLLMLATNMLQVAAGGLMPLVAVVIWGRAGVAAVMATSGIGMLALAAIYFAWALHDSRGAAVMPEDPSTPLKPPVRELLAYGLPRVPGFVAMASLMSIGPILVAHMDGLANSAYLSIGLQLLTTAALPVRAMAAVFLPRFAQLKADARDAEASRVVQLLAAMMLELGTFAALQLVVFMPLLVPIWINRHDPQGIFIVTLLALAVPAYLTYETLRNPLDSHSVTPINTFSLLGALAVMALGSFGLHFAGLPALQAVSWATVAAFFALGISTRNLALKLLVRPGEQLVTPAQMLTSFGLALLLGATGWGLRFVLPRHSTLLLVALIALFELVALAAFIGLELRLGNPWALELKRRVLGRLGKV